MRRWAGILLGALAMLCSLAALSGQPDRSGDRFTASSRTFVHEAPNLPDGIVSINEAEEEELLMLPGIGETLARAILDERELHGPFHYPEDLMAVRGIGKARLAQIQPYLILSE